jgi:hypothetical protein
VYLLYCLKGKSIQKFIPFASQRIFIEPKAHELELDEERSIYYLSKKSSRWNAVDV